MFHIYIYIYYIYIILIHTPKTSLRSHAGLMYMYIYMNIYTHARFIHPDQNEVLESAVKTHLVSIPWGLVLAALINPTESCVFTRHGRLLRKVRRVLAWLHGCAWLCMV